MVNVDVRDKSRHVREKQVGIFRLVNTEVKVRRAQAREYSYRLRQIDDYTDNRNCWKSGHIDLYSNRT